MKKISLRASGSMLIIAVVLSGCASQPASPTKTAPRVPAANVAQPAATVTTNSDTNAAPTNAAPKVNVNRPKPVNKNTAPKPAQPTAKAVTMAMVAQNDSGETGTVTLTDTGGKTKVSIALNRAPFMYPQPAYIYVGSCGSLGTRRHTLNYIVKGQSSTVLLFPLDQILKDKPLAVNVHKDQSDMLTSVSCASIK
jgi:hypothetical protein